MSDPIERLREEANRTFLGRNSVVGVGITDDAGESKLVFLLSKNTCHAKEAILGWAREHSIKVRFIVTGSIMARETQ